MNINKITKAFFIVFYLISDKQFSQWFIIRSTDDVSRFNELSMLLLEVKILRGIVGRTRSYQAAIR
jgi:hypothetical protein